MSWWGKAIGGAFGFLLGGPLGAILGVALGHNFDRGLSSLSYGTEGGFSVGDQERTQMAFFTATFSVMGCIAKADGKVTRDEIHLAESVMTQMALAPDMRSAAIKLFNQGKHPSFPLEQVMEQFRRECHRRRDLYRIFMEIQLQAAYADGDVHPVERAVLMQVCQILGISKTSGEPGTHSSFFKST